MRRGRRGLTLAEAVIALFVLASGFATLFLLFHSGGRYATMAENQSTAVLVAERSMERIRGWSRQVHGPSGSTDFTDWSGCPVAATAHEDPDAPGFFLRCVTASQPLMSPCSLFENLKTSTQRRSMEHSVRRVELHVTWGSRGHQTSLFGGTVEHVLVSLVSLATGDPPANSTTVYPVALSGGSTLAQGDSVTLTPHFDDGHGRNVPDLFFRSIVSPESGSGFGTLLRDDASRTVKLKHAISLGTAPDTYSPGRCEVEAVARYCGREVRARSNQLELSP